MRCETHNSDLKQENVQNVPHPFYEDVTNGVTPESLQFRIRCPPLSLLALILAPSFIVILFPRNSAVPLIIHFLSFYPTLNLLLDPFNHLLATQACCRVLLPAVLR